MLAASSPYLLSCGQYLVAYHAWPRAPRANISQTYPTLSPNLAFFSPPNLSYLPYYSSELWALAPLIFIIGGLGLRQHDNNEKLSLLLQLGKRRPRGYFFTPGRRWVEKPLPHSWRPRGNHFFFTPGRRWVEKPLPHSFEPRFESRRPDATKWRLALGVGTQSQQDPTESRAVDQRVIM